MANELRPDEMQNLWRNQPLEPVRMSADDMRCKAQRFEAKTRRGFRGLAVLMILGAAGWAWLLYFFPSTAARIGASLTLAAYLYCGWQLHKRGPARKLPAHPVLATCAAYRQELARHRDFTASLWWKFMLPFVPGPAVFIMGFLIPEQGLVKAVGLTTALILPPFLLAIPLHRQGARKLQREIDALAALMKRP